MLRHLLTLVLCCVLLVGCTPENSTETVSFATWGSITEVKILKQIIFEFEKENPRYKVQLLHIPQNYFQKIHLLFASNTPPDVVFINNLNLPVYKDFLEEISFCFNEKDFYKQALDGLTIDGKLYGIPRDISNLVFYVNTDKINLPNSNWRLEDLYKIKLKKDYVIGIENDIYWALPYISYFGGQICDKNSSMLIDDVNTQKGLRFYLDLRDKHKIAPEDFEIGSSTLAQMFLDEKIGLYLSGRWMYPKISEKAKFNWSVINFPYGQNFQPCDVSGWAIPKNAKNKAGAIEFVKFVSSKHSLDYMTSTGLIVPARIESSKALEQDLHNEKVFLEVIPQSKNTLVCKNYKKIVDKINSKYLK